MDEKLRKIVKNVIYFGSIIFAIGLGCSISIMETGLYLLIFPFWTILYFLELRRAKKEEKKSPLLPYIVILAVFAISIIISSFFAYAKSAIWKNFYPVKFIARFLPLFIFPTILSMDNFVKLLSVSVIVGTANAVYGILRYIATGVRGGGFIKFYMTFAGVSMLLGLSSLFLSLIHLRKNKKLALFYIICFVILTLGIMFSLTRNALLGICAGIAILAFTLPRIGIPIMLIISSIALTTYVAVPQVATRVNSIISLHEESINERLILWKGWVENFGDFYLTGRGLGSANTEKFCEKFSVNAKERCHFHNNFLQIWFSLGILGIVAFMLLFILSYYYATKILKESKQYENKISGGYIISVLTAFLVAGVFEYNFGDSEVVTLFFFLLSSLLITKARSEARNIEK
jgi:O-antigen ligase